MNTSLIRPVSTTSDRHDHPPQPVPALHTRPERRVALLDRAALHLGMALIMWGRRTRAIESRERRASRHEQYLTRLARERAAERWISLNLPPR
ncbi:hypothetical protein [Leifsonia sp. Root112D2]|uniref:hypothetical protein n=1 Tax=Leifsonia sp. Root112D2 TaxID=1736426 RepID=UPI0006FA9500|nr:hypothetical protein [Leifsonia sp. Root112D2]